MSNRKTNFLENICVLHLLIEMFFYDCCLKKYADRRRHGNHKCNGYMGEMCPSTHGLRVKKRTQGSLEVAEWRKVNYNDNSFMNANLL